MERIMDEDHTVEVVYLDFIKALGPVNHRVLVANMKPFGLVDVVRDIELYLTGRAS